MVSMKCPSCGSPNIVKINSTEYKCENCNTTSKLSNDQTYLVLQKGSPCPSCGFYNENDVRFCGDCGTQLVKTCITCGTETQIEKNFCPNCGNSIFDDKALSPKGLYDVILKPGLQNYKKIEVIKLIRGMTNLGLVEAKNISETITVIASRTTIDDANDLKKKFEQLGAIIEIMPANDNNKSNFVINKNVTGQMSQGSSCMAVMTLIGLILVVIWLVVL
jgi:hypothetical protein